MIAGERAAILEEEVYILRDSGEIPEIAYHSSLNYLTVESDGPRIILTDAELKLLQHAALYRYREIVLRDLNPDNRDLGIYRGVRRTLYNWQRMQNFCARIGQDCSPFKGAVEQALRDFLGRELADVRNGLRSSCVNCTAAGIIELAKSIDMALDELPRGWQLLCVAEER